MSFTDSITEYGFTAVPSSASTVLNHTSPRPTSPPPIILVSETSVPTTPLAQRIQAYARNNLPEPTYNHSLRVYHYGLAIKKYRFPDWHFSDETWFLSCLLHDIGTTDENLQKTRLSFEFYGGYLALDVLQHAPSSSSSSSSSEKEAVAPREQAESVAEAIIRHQDQCDVGKITAVGQLIQLATLFDNTGTLADLVHPSTIEDVSKNFPRLKWSNCFAATIRRENSLKPWAHTTTLGEEAFPANVLGNKLMAPYE